jgi:Tol biopolymer transport system component
MTDDRVDALLRRLDVPSSPPAGFAASSQTALLPLVRAARARDASPIGRLRRDLGVALQSAGAAVRPRSRARSGVAWALLLVTLLLAAVLVTILAGSHRRLPPPFGLAGNGRIAFMADGHVFTSAFDGSDREQLTFGDGTELAPTFSPDGTKIAYRRFGPDEPVGDPQLADVVVADADGSHSLVLDRAARALSNIAWSPDSAFVAYSRAAPPDHDRSFVTPADGSGPPRDLGAFSDDSWGPTWSPDGTQLAIATVRGLFVVRRDGTDPRKLTHGSYVEIGQKGEGSEWSPDGRSIVFSAGSPDGPTQVYLVGLDGAAERQISVDNWSANGATWSPDGSRIAYMRSGTGTGPLAVITDAAGREIRQLAGEYGWYQPTWSPDGRSLIVTDDQPGPANVAGPAIRVILDVAGDGQPIVIPAAGVTPDMLPDWAASWQRIALP